MQQQSRGIILVLCEGNHCRSPIAEGLLRSALGPGIQVESAGLAAEPGYAAHAIAVDLMAAREIDITAFRSRQVTPAMAIAAGLILVMDRRQKAWCESLAPSTRGRVYLLGSWLPPERQEIPDPMGKDREVFDQAFGLILESVDTWLPHLNSFRNTL